jgi:hypothetical protein
LPRTDENIDKLNDADEEDREHAAAVVASSVVSQETSPIDGQHASSPWRGRLKCSGPTSREDRVRGRGATCHAILHIH